MREILISKDPKHGKTINDLAKEGKMHKCQFTLPNGETKIANSYWTATAMLKELGFYNPNERHAVIHIKDI